jgi:pimeloyl-ACP methyl ester carboxylesterase
MQVPETEFAHCGDIQIAYQVYGSGPVELVVCGGPAGHIELYWEEPLVHRWYERLGRFARVALFDRRGTGASDSASSPPSEERYMEDLAAVIDACGFERPALVGAVEAARMSALFAANHPERVSALVLVDTAARGRDTIGDDRIEWLTELIESRWGKGDLTSLYAPSMIDNDRFRRWIGRMERLSVSPHGARQIIELMRESDVSHVLPRIQCPTLVIHHRENSLVPVELGEAVAAAIPHARFTTVAGQDSMAWLGDADALIGEIEEFLTGSRTPVPCNELRAIMVTDIVGSTELAARLHHSRWQRLLAEHYELLRREIELNAGRAVKGMGDGFLAMFAEPEPAIRAARQIVAASSSMGLDVRVGIHVGAVEPLVDDVRGIAVHIAARICERAARCQILVSGTVNDILIDSEIPLKPISEERLRGVPGRWGLYEVALDTEQKFSDQQMAAIEPDGVGAATAPGPPGEVEDSAQTASEPELSSSSQQEVCQWPASRAFASALTRSSASRTHLPATSWGGWWSRCRWPRITHGCCSRWPHLRRDSVAPTGSSRG